MSTYLGRALLILGAGFLLSVALIGACALLGRTVPDVLQNLAVGSMGMIGALLARGAGEPSGASEASGRPETPTG